MSAIVFENKATQEVAEYAIAQYEEISWDEPWENCWQSVEQFMMEEAMSWARQEPGYEMREDGEIMPHAYALLLIPAVYKRINWQQIADAIEQRLNEKEEDPEPVEEEEEEEAEDPAPVEEEEKICEQCENNKLTRNKKNGWGKPGWDFEHICDECHDEENANAPEVYNVYDMTTNVTDYYWNPKKKE